MSSLSSPALVADDAPSTRRALVIDDSRAQRSMLRRLLADRGYEVNEAGDGLEGVDSLARQGAVELCLVDWNMPNLNGLTFHQTVRENHDTDPIPLYMVPSARAHAHLSPTLMHRTHTHPL